MSLWMIFGSFATISPAEEAPLATESSCRVCSPILTVAHVGLTETEATRKGLATRVAKLPAAAVLRTRTIGETGGFMKALIDPKNDRILGFNMVGPEAGEVLAVVQMAMLAGSPYTVLSEAILTHPTMAEGLNALFSAVKQESAAAKPSVA